MDKIKAFRQILSDRDLIIVHLKNKGLITLNSNQDGHFHEVLQNFNLKSPSTLNQNKDINLLLKELEELVKKQNFIFKKEDEIRIRALSVFEAPFRGCLGGIDCSTRTYFDKALDPNFIYFTLTDTGFNSSGHVTLVLGTAKDENNNETNVAFIDKIQNVSNNMIPIFLEGVRRSLKEKDYTLIMPKEVGDHNGLSNESTTRDFIKTQRPLKEMTFYNFTPHKHLYNFDNEHSRAYDQLEAYKVLPLKENPVSDQESKEQSHHFYEDSIGIQEGEEYLPTQAPENLSLQTLIEPIMNLGSSTEESDLLDFLTFAGSAETLKKYGFDSKLYWQIVAGVFKTTSSDSIKKQFLYALLIYREDQDHLLVEENFSRNLWQQILGELPQWGKSSNEKRKNVWKRISTPNFEFFEANIKNLEVIKLYFKNPLVDINAKNNNGYTVLMWAFVTDSIEVVKLLLSYPDINVSVKDKFGHTALMRASQYGDIEVVKLLLSHPNIDVNAKDNNGSTALMWASSKGHIEVVKLLLSHPNIDVNTKDNDGSSALTWASQNGHIKIVKLLKQAGALE